MTNELHSINFQNTDITNNDIRINEQPYVEKINTTNPYERIPEQDKLEISSQNKNVKKFSPLAATGLLALSGLSCVAIIDTIFCHGKHIDKLLEKIGLKKGDVIKTIENFKKEGFKFDKGKALTPDGKNFTGAIEHIDKKHGTRDLLYYEDGRLTHIDGYKKDGSGNYNKKPDFHELKHVKQYATAYATNPEELAKAIYNGEIPIKISDAWRELPEKMKQSYNEITNGVIEPTIQKFKEFNNYEDVIRTLEDDITNRQDLLEMFPGMDYDKFLQRIKASKNEEEFEKNVRLELLNSFKETVNKRAFNDFSNEEKEMFENIDWFSDSNHICNEITKGTIKLELKKRFGNCIPLEPGTEEYKKGLDYIEASGHYINPDKDYDAYCKNLLESEAFGIGDIARRIAEYIKTNI